MSLTFVKLPSSWKGSLFLCTCMKDGGRKGFNLTLTDGDKIWDGQLTEEDLDALSSGLKMDFDTYVRQTAQAFTRQDLTSVNFIYELKPQADDVMDLVWKKEVPGDIKIKMGSVPLYVNTNGTETMCQIFTSIIDMMADLQKKISSSEAENQRLLQDRQNALKRLDKSISAKEELEKDLYSKFVAVLNKKKEKIRALQNGEAEASMSQASTNDLGKAEADEDEHVHNSSKGKRKPAAQGTDDGAGHTDEETAPVRKRGRVKATGGDADTSLPLDEGGNANVEDSDGSHKGKTVVRRPARQRDSNKRQTPAKPVLPKVTSRSSDTGTKTPRRTSMRKSGSGGPPRSAPGEDDLDPEDLLKDF